METNTADPGPAQHGGRFGPAGHVFVRSTSEKPIAGAKKVDTHKTSMWQNVTVEHAPETNALAGTVIELSRLTNTPTPHFDAAGQHDAESTRLGWDVAERLKNADLSLRTSCLTLVHPLTQAPFHLIGANKAHCVGT